MTDLRALFAAFARNPGAGHRLTALIGAAVRAHTDALLHVLPESGVGMSDKSAFDPTCETCIQRHYCRQHGICHYTGSPFPETYPQTEAQPAACRGNDACSDCQSERPRGITHAPDSPLRRVPRFAQRPVNPAEQEGDPA